MGIERSIERARSVGRVVRVSDKKRTARRMLNYDDGRGVWNATPKMRSGVSQLSELYILFVLHGPVDAASLLSDEALPLRGDCALVD